MIYLYTEGKSGKLTLLWRSHKEFTMAQAMLIGGSTRIVVPGGLVARGRIIEVHPRTPVLPRRFTEDEAFALADELSDKGQKVEAARYLDAYFENNRRMSH